jgi:hypothetical protein
MYELKRQPAPQLTVLSAELAKSDNTEFGSGGGAGGRRCPSHNWLWAVCVIGAVLLVIGAILLSRDPYVIAYRHYSSVFGYVRVSCEGLLFATGISMVGICALFLHAHHEAAKLETNNGPVRSLRKKRLEKVSDGAIFGGIILVVVQVLTNFI